MFQYLIKRLLLMIPTLLGIYTVVFLLTNLAPGGPVDGLIQQVKYGTPGGDARSDVQITEEYIEKLKSYYGFDKPLYQRYFIYLGKLLSGDLGHSYHFNQPVAELIKRRLPVSLSFGVWSFFLAYLLCIPLGVYKAVRDGSRMDHSSSVLLFIAYSIPSYVLAILLIYFFAGGSHFSWFPLRGLSSSGSEHWPFLYRVGDYFHHLVLPLFSYTIGGFATMTLLMKNSLLEEIKKDYVRTARAKGLSERLVIFKHALKNALIPLATGIGSFLGLFLAGSMLLERIFSLQGIGLLNFDAMLAYDFQTVMSVIMLGSVAMLAGNLLSDISYVLINPKIDFK